MKTLAFFLFFICSVGSANANEDVTSRLSKLAEMHNCKPLWELERIPKDAGEWKFSIDFMTGDKNDYIFMCEINKKQHEYKIIIATDKMPDVWSSCPSEIYAGYSAPYPTTLRIYQTVSPESFPKGLKGWFTADEKEGPENIVVTGPLVDTSAQDLGVVLYCYDKEWYGLFIH
ncbi:MAG: hypothetical protein GY820_20955 [Gammaproteobacteria bacterium]|nr:hypothetical protein [Gammaproteobacteria bacterium]MCP4489760.1 hypothetical protein [Gammaproteobacteria bacterium]